MQSASLPLLLVLLLFGSCRQSLPGRQSSPARETAAPPPAANRPPNVVLILMDDLGWSDVGFNGSPFYQTPNLDRLARQSLRFTNAYAASPVCSPTRASLLTGQYPARLQITDWLPGRTDRPSQKLLRAELRQELPLETVTLAEVFQQAGYATAHIGKWHLGGEGYGPEEQGFGLNIGGDHTGTPATYFSPYHNEQHPNWKIQNLSPGAPGEYLTDRLTTAALRFMEQHRERPFFLYLPHFAVHIPLKAKPELMEKHRQRPVPPGSSQTNAIYAAMIESMDESVGRIMARLDELRLSEHTIVIFTSDNGGLSVEEGPHTPATSNAPLREGKGHLYEGGIRVPLLVKGPQVVKPGSVSDEPVSSIDFYPTLLQLANIPLPAGQKVDGVSLVPLLQDQRSLDRQELYWHYPHYSNQHGKPGTAIRQGDFKLIAFYEGGVELYNLKEDPSEQKNLAATMPAKVQQLQGKITRWRQEVGARQMQPNPEYKAEK
jgi:arylsulfatase A